MTSSTVADLDLTVQRLKALGDDKRLRILTRLAGGECCVCDLMDELETGQSLLSFHLKTLKDAGLVRDRRAGRWVHYSLNVEVLAEVEDYLRMIRETPAHAVATGDVCCD